MRALSLLLAFGLSALASGCVIVDGESTKEYDCAFSAYASTTDAAAVVVTDRRGEPLCGAQVVVRSGAFEETLSPSYTCHIFQIPSQHDVYDITVTMAGYQTFAASNINYNAGSGCAGQPLLTAALEPAPLGCDSSAALSFQVDLRDERGAPVCDASIVVRDGAFEQTLRPTPTSDGACFWDGPVERPGTYQVTVTKPGYETLVLPAVAVTKAPDACHIVPGKVSATLVPSKESCTRDVVEAIALTVRDETGAAICDATVTARDGSFSATLQSSALGGACAWSGLPERSGVYDVTVSKPGYVTAVVEDVIVTADSCHVKTVALEVTLAPAPPSAPTGG